MLEEAFYVCFEYDFTLPILKIMRKILAILIVMSFSACHQASSCSTKMRTQSSKERNIVKLFQTEGGKKWVEDTFNQKSTPGNPLRESSLIKRVSKFLNDLKENKCSEFQSVPYYAQLEDETVLRWDQYTLSDSKWKKVHHGESSLLTKHLINRGLGQFNMVFTDDNQKIVTVKYESRLPSIKVIDGSYSFFKKLISGTQEYSILSCCLPEINCS